MEGSAGLVFWMHVAAGTGNLHLVTLDLPIPVLVTARIKVLFHKGKTFLKRPNKQ